MHVAGASSPGILRYYLLALKGSRLGQSKFRTSPSSQLALSSAADPPPHLLRQVLTSSALSLPTPAPTRGCTPGLLSTFSLYRANSTDPSCADPTSSGGLACAARCLSLGTSGLCTSCWPRLLGPLCGLDRGPPHAAGPPWPLGGSGIPCTPAAQPRPAPSVQCGEAARGLQRAACHLLQQRGQRAPALEHQQQS